MKLNLGCNETSIDGFQNIDILKLSNVDIVADVRKLDFAANESVDEIMASHILEHFGYHEVTPVLDEWNRVLKINGIFYISVPDIMEIVEFINQYGWNVWIEHLIYGDQDYETAYHKSAYTEESLKERLINSGFDNIKRVDLFPLNIEGKTASKMQAPNRISQTDNKKYMSLSLMARKHLNIKREGRING